MQLSASKIILKGEVYLVVGAGVSEDKETGLTEGGLELVGKGTRCVPSCNWVSPSVLRKLQDSPLTVRPGRLHNNVLGILNCNNDSSRQHQLIPSLTQVDDVDT